MSERPFRYHDEARLFGESLAEIKVAEEPERRSEGLARIAAGDTAFASMPATQAAAAAGVPDTLQKADIRKRLQALMTSNRQKMAAKHCLLDNFCANVEKLANPSGPDVTPSAMTSGTNRPVEPAETQGVGRFSGTHQGPAANFFAAGLKAMNEEHARRSHG